MRIGRLLNGTLLIPRRAEGPGGIIGDGVEEIDQTSPEFESSLADYERQRSRDHCTIHRGDPASPVLLHVPHASRHIPAEIRENIQLDDDELAAELLSMTDLHTDRLALAAARTVTLQPWVVVNDLSRLVVDPERFPDEREEMRSVGMGAVYTKTSTGATLRRPSASDEEHLLWEYFHPYANLMTDLVRNRIAACGQVILLDIHSYPSRALPYELHGDLRRPALCIGQDAFHTPDSLTAKARAAFADLGDVAVNEPFSGSYVPTRFYQSEPDVQSLMLEIRRDQYLEESTGDVDDDGAERVVSAMRRLLEDLDTG